MASTDASSTNEPDDTDAPRDLSKRSVQRIQQRPPVQPGPTQAMTPMEKAMAIFRQLAPRGFNAKAREQQLRGADEEMQQ